MIDVLEQKPASHDFKTAITDVSFVIRACLLDLRGEDVEITVEGSTIRIVSKNAYSHAPSESVVCVPSGYSISDTHAAYLNGELRIIILKSAA